LFRRPKGAALVNFPGFEKGDFSLFSIPDFAGRMGAIRGTLRPKLIALGEDLNDRIAAVTGIPSFPHVAQHMRRRVNPPVETWVAFCRDRRGYKRWTHYRVAVSEQGVRVTVFVEDDADDKARFGERLAADPAAIRKALGARAPVLWYTLDADGPIPQADVTDAALGKLGGSLERVKTSKFQAGTPLPHDEALRLGPEGFEEWALEQVQTLKPLYLAGAADLET